MAVKTASLVVSLIDRLTAPARGMNAAIDSLTGQVRRNAAQMDAMRGRMMDSVGAAYALARGLASPVTAAITFESAMSDIRKVVDFETPQAFAKMGKEIRAMAVDDIPMAADGIAAIVAAAGQSGIATTELTNFAGMAAKVAVAWETAAGETGEHLAKLKTGLGLTLQETSLLADAINHLGNNTAANAPSILKVVRIVGPMGKQFGMTTQEVAALGAAMVGAGFEAEVASTSILNVGRALTKGAGGSKRFKSAFKSIGLSAANVSKSMQKDAMGTLQNVLTRISKAPKHLQAGLISDIFGDEARALGPLISNGKLLQETLALVADQSNYAGSAQKEFEEASTRTANALQFAKNRVNDIAISIGDALLPGINEFLTAVGPMLKSVSQLAQQYPMATRAIVAATAGVVGFRVAASAAAWSGLFLKGGLLQMGLAGLTAARSLAAIPKTLIFGPMIAGFGALRTAIMGSAAAAGALQAKTALGKAQEAYKGAVAMRELAKSGQVAGLSMKEATADVRRTGMALATAQQNMKSANAAMVASSASAKIMAGAMKMVKVALISTGVGAILVGIGAAAAFIYQNWTGITQAMQAFGPAFMNALGPAKLLIDPVVDGISSLVQWFGNLFQPLDASGEKWAQWGSSAGDAVGGAVKYVMELPGKLIALAPKIADAAVEMMGGLKDGVVQIVGEIVDYIGNAFASAFAGIGARASSLLNTVTFGLAGKSAETAAPSTAGAGAQVDGARADGGPVRAGGTYLVGEEGPELFTPGRGGMVHPNDVFRRATAGRAANAAPAPQARPPGPATININLQIDVHGETDINRIAQRLGQMIRSEVQGLHADLNYAVGV